MILRIHFSPCNKLISYVNARTWHIHLSYHKVVKVEFLTTQVDAACQNSESNNKINLLANSLYVTMRYFALKMVHYTALKYRKQLRLFKYI